jgi:hypothetical protein
MQCELKLNHPFNSKILKTLLVSRCRETTV